MRLKEPLGMLIKGSLSDTMVEVRKLIAKERPPKIVAVGDRVSQDFADHSIHVDVMIVDNKIMRKRTAPISAAADRVIHVANMPGTIADEAWAVLEWAMEGSQRTKVIVDGEEDLLTLVAIMQSPEDSLVFYGQPYEGIVAVKVTAKVKREMCVILEAMAKD